jgi:hypothetical protein
VVIFPDLVNLIACNGTTLVAVLDTFGVLEVLELEVSAKTGSAEQMITDNISIIEIIFFIEISETQ